jgi:hypothetical protein
MQRGMRQWRAVSPWRAGLLLACVLLGLFAPALGRQPVYASAQVRPATIHGPASAAVPPAADGDADGIIDAVPLPLEPLLVMRGALVPPPVRVNRIPNGLRLRPPHAPPRRSRSFSGERLDGEGHDGRPPQGRTAPAAAGAGRYRLVSAAASLVCAVQRTAV